MVKGRRPSETPTNRIMALKLRTAHEMTPRRLKRLKAAAQNRAEKELYALRIQEHSLLKKFEEAKEKFENIRGWPPHLTKLRFEIEYYEAQRNYLESQKALAKRYLELAHDFQNILKFVPEETQFYKRQNESVIPKELSSVEFRIRMLKASLEKTAAQWRKFSRILRNFVRNDSRLNKKYIKMKTSRFDAGRSGSIIIKKLRTKSRTLLSRLRHGKITQTTYEIQSAKTYAEQYGVWLVNAIEDEKYWRFWNEAAKIHAFNFIAFSDSFLEELSRRVYNARDKVRNIEKILKELQG